MDSQKGSSKVNSNDMTTEYGNSNGSDEEQQPTTFSNKSIAVKGLSMGITDLSNDVCQQIADELSRKMKELIYTAKLIMTRNKATTLSTTDVKKAMKLLGGCEIYGHGTHEPSKFIHVPELDLFVEEDSIIDVFEHAMEESSFQHWPDPYIQGAWILPEGYSKEITASTANSSYYRKIATTIMTGSPAHVRVALRDLRSNPKIGPLCPFFLNLVAETVEEMYSVEREMRHVELINTLISTVHAIAHNRFVDSSPYSAVNRAVNSLLKIVIETNMSSTFDDLGVRFRAGLLLAKVLITWSIELKQQMGIVECLLQHLLDPKRPLQSHYGAIVALTALGQRTYDFYFWPVIERYLPQLECRESENHNVMVQHVVAAILVAAKSTHQKEPTSIEQLLTLYKVEQTLYLMFGDSITPLRMAMKNFDNVYPLAKPLPKPKAHSFYGFKDSDNSTSLERSRKRRSHLTCASGDLFLIL